MTPAELDITIRTGLTFGPVVITCMDAEGALVDLTGWSAFAEVRKKAASAVVVDLLPEITDAEAGEITIELTDEQTAELTVGAYYWDLVLERPSGERLGPFIAGAATVQGVITQPA